MGNCFRNCCLLLWCGALPWLHAQTANTGLVQGTVTDPSGAAVPAAVVEITDKGAGTTIRQTAGQDGVYVFPNLSPGDYSIKISAPGFSTATVEGLKVEVTKSYTYDVKLEVGQSTQTVVVTAEAKLELQTVDSTVGNVIPRTQLPTLPTFTRQAVELLTLQPAATPNGEVSGARRDQTTLTLDGIDVSQNSVGGLAAYMYLGVEGLEEYNVAVANPNSSFGRGGGGQVSLVGRRGTNRLHGNAFWYHQNDNLNANTWDRNRIGLKKPETKDNRYGFTVGGPVWKEKTFFFTNWEQRKFPRASTVTRIVPRDSLRQGILRFRDQAGTINSYDLRTAQTCGVTGDSACDPRGLGLSPAIRALFAQMPAGNDESQGDSLNTIGLTGVVTHPIEHDFYHARLDHNLTQNWRIMASIRYYNLLDINNGSVDIRGGASNFQSIRTFPTRQNMEVIGVSGAITSTLTGDFRFGRVRNRAATDVFRPSASSQVLNLPGTQTSAGTIALDIGGRGGAQNILSEPFDVDTQLARKQQNDARIYQYNADMNWIKAKHNIQFGGHFRNLPTLHRRDDKVVGALGSLVAQLDAQRGVISLNDTVAPPPCGAGRTAGCLLASDLETYYRLYAGVTGLVDNISVLAARDGSFNPLPLGDLLESDTTGIHAPEFYVQDVWRMKPSLTLTYGLNYGWQTPPKERLGRYTLQTLQATGAPVTAEEFLTQRKNAAAQGNIYNPNFAFNPVNNAKADVFNIDWNNIGPRAAVAWQPAFQGGVLGKIFGDKRTVFRGGYGLTFDRQNTVQSVIIPSLGIGFAQTLNVNAPLCNASGAPGAGCQASSANTAVNGFRVGVDGALPLPTVPQQTVPVSPAWGQVVNGRAQLFPEILSFQVDPNIKVGENHALNLTLQREMGRGLIAEVGYLGRFGRKLPQSMNLMQSPYTMLDRASGQTFAQAFDAVATAIRTNQTPANQPFFENNVPNGGTQALVRTQRNAFLNGNVAQMFQAIDRDYRILAGLQPFNNYVSQMSLLRTSPGRSNYNAGFLTLRGEPAKGLFLNLTYTMSKSLDQLGEWQNSANVMPNSFDLDVEYGPSLFDITHIFNGVWSYRVPFKSGNRFLDLTAAGWEVSGIYTARSGDPLVLVQGSEVWGGTLNLGFNSGMIPTVDPATFGNSVNQNVAGSNNIGINGNPATRGTGLNLFANPEQVFNSFRHVQISKDGRAGRANPIRGLPRWNLDASLAKTFRVVGKDNPLNVRLSFDFFNMLNNVMYANPTMAYTNPRAFGVLTSQFVPNNRTDGSRWIQAALRIDF